METSLISVLTQLVFCKDKRNPPFVVMSDYLNIHSKEFLVKI